MATCRNYSRQNTKRMKEYYIPALVVGAVAEARAKDQRTGKRKPPLYAAYVHLLQTGLYAFLSDKETENAVLTNCIHVHEKDTDCWQRVNLPIPDEIHMAIKATAQAYDRRFYDFAHCLFLEAVRGFDYSILKR